MNPSNTAALPESFGPRAARLRDIQVPRVDIDWLWQGYLAAGSITLLTSQWKSGKTTLLSILLDRLKAGGTLADLPVKPARAAVVSEETAQQWLQRGQKFDLADHVHFLCRPFLTQPSHADWLGLIAHLAELRQHEGIDLAVIDSLAAFLPGTENSATSILKALAPLQRLTPLGLSLLILHHPRKGKSPGGQASRGSGALTAFVDILIEMEYLEGPGIDDRRRQLHAYSRFEQTPRDLIIELNAAGTDYLTHGTLWDVEFAASWEVIAGILGQADTKLNRLEILEGWPVDLVKPPESTLFRWLARAVSEARVLQTGQGRRNSPYRYWLASQEAKWRENPLQRMFLEQEEQMEREKKLLEEFNW